MLRILSISCGLLLSAATGYALILGSTAQTFGVCAASTVTNAGYTVITGGLGLSPGTSLVGFPPGTATAIEIGSAASIACEDDASLAYAAILASTTTEEKSGVALDNLTLPPGVYNFNEGAGLSANLTFDAGGNATAQFLFKITSTLITSADVNILLTNGALACNIFWAVGSSATIGATNTFLGTIIAYTSIGVGQDTTAVGGFYALNGAVTLLGNNVTSPGAC